MGLHRSSAYPWLDHLNGPGSSTDPNQRCFTVKSDAPGLAPPFDQGSFSGGLQYVGLGLGAEASLDSKVLPANLYKREPTSGLEPLTAALVRSDPSGVAGGLHEVAKPAFLGGFLSPGCCVLRRMVRPMVSEWCQYRSRRINLGSRSIRKAQHIAVGLGAIRLPDEIATNDADPTAALWK